MNVYDEEANEINNLVFNEDWYLLEDFTAEFPTEAVKQGASVVTIGFVP